LAKSKSVDSPCKTESYLFSCLKKLGHKPEILELEENLDPLVDRVNQSGNSVDMVFNLLEELSGEAKFDFHAISYLESKGIPFSGNGPRSLMLTRDKALTKLVVKSLGYVTPAHTLIRTEQDLINSTLRYPLFLKFNLEDASLGISQKNKVHNLGEAIEIYRGLKKKLSSHVIAEEFVPGRDLSISILGNKRKELFPARELTSPGEGWVAGEKVKFRSDLRREKKIRSIPAKWSTEKEKLSAFEMSRFVYSELGMRGYGRLDFRRTPEGELYFLEANANPDLAKDEDFSVSAKAFGYTYEDLISKIIKLSLF